MPHYTVSVERVSVNQLTETTMHGKLTTSNKEEPYESSRRSRPPVRDGKAPTFEGVFRREGKE